MKILQIHNRYKGGLSGEDVVVEQERQLLERYGHRVDQYFAFNSDLDTRSLRRSIYVGLNSIWSQPAYQQVLANVYKYQPDIVHIHNTFATLSPSIFWALKRVGVASVLTLHNFRLTCATSVLLRNGRPCEACVGHLPLAALRYRCCYDASLATGLSISTSQLIHAMLRTYAKKVDAFIVLTEFSASIMARAGLPREKMYVKPNFITVAPDQQPSLDQKEKQIIYAGQITAAKGVDLLITAWLKLQPTGYRLVLVGDGPLRESLQQATASRQDILWKGRLDHASTIKEIARSHFLVLPSRWYETQGMVLIEAQASLTPVIVPNHGSFPFVVDLDKNAIPFIPNSVESLAVTLEKALAFDERTRNRYAQSGRETYLTRYTPERNYQILMAIYESARGRVPPPHSA